MEYFSLVARFFDIAEHNQIAQDFDLRGLDTTSEDEKTLACAHREVSNIVRVLENEDFSDKFSPNAAQEFCKQWDAFDAESAWVDRHGNTLTESGNYFGQFTIPTEAPGPHGFYAESQLCQVLSRFDMDVLARGRRVALKVSDVIALEEWVRRARRSMELISRETSEDNARARFILLSRFLQGAHYFSPVPTGEIGELFVSIVSRALREDSVSMAYDYAERYSDFCLKEMYISEYFPQCRHEFLALSSTYARCSGEVYNPFIALMDGNLDSNTHGFSEESVFAFLLRAVWPIEQLYFFLPEFFRTLTDEAIATATKVVSDNRTKYSEAPKWLRTEKLLVPFLHFLNGDNKVPISIDNTNDVRFYQEENYDSYVVFDHLFPTMIRNGDFLALALLPRVTVSTGLKLRTDKRTRICADTARRVATMYRAGDNVDLLISVARPV